MKQIFTVDRQYPLRDNTDFLIANEPVGQNCAVPDVDRETSFSQGQIEFGGFNSPADGRTDQQKCETIPFVLGI